MIQLKYHFNLYLKKAILSPFVNCWAIMTIRICTVTRDLGPWVLLVGSSLSALISWRDELLALHLC